MPRAAIPVAFADERARLKTATGFKRYCVHEDETMGSEEGSRASQDAAYAAPLARHFWQSRILARSDILTGNQTIRLEVVSSIFQTKGD